MSTTSARGSAVITLRTYAHLWPGDEDRTRNVLDAALSPLASQSDSSGAEATFSQVSDLRGSGGFLGLLLGMRD